MAQFNVHKRMPHRCEQVMARSSVDQQRMRFWRRRFPRLSRSQETTDFHATLLVGEIWNMNHHRRIEFEKRAAAHRKR